ncbi:hypothetical protein DFH06DRAFT_1485040 [Mycena polygramma]|nr:hypothetical protein DFH06DRAFT_1485040 [Mycena polygramma]
MHRCLGILEMRQEICSHLDPTDGQTLTTRTTLNSAALATLAAMARTCTIFSSPALDILWRAQSEFGPFLRLMPDDLFVLSPTQKYFGLGVWHIWDMGLDTTVRFTTPGSGDSKSPQPVLSEQLFVSQPPHCVLARHTASISHPHLFPTYAEAHHALRLGGVHHGGITSLSLLSTLATSCPGLRHVSIYISPGSESDRVDTAMSLFVGQLRSVHSLVIHAPTMAILNQIAHLPQLTALELGGHSFQYEAIEGIHSPMFPRLRRLNLGSIETRSATKLFRCLSRTSLVVLRMTLTTHPAMSALFQALRSTDSHESLGSLKITAYGYDDPPGGSNRTCCISGRSVSALACFRNMTTLHIESSMGPDLDDATMATLASAWPLFQRFTLEVDDDVVSTPWIPTKITIQCLQSFARHCPLLQYLAISFHATSVPSLRDESAVQSSLKELQVGFSPISDPAPVSQYLWKLFPLLRQVRARGVEENTNFHLWARVEDQIWDVADPGWADGLDSEEE